MSKIIDRLSILKQNILGAKPLELGLLVALVIVTAAATMDVVGGDHSTDLAFDAGAIGDSHAEIALSAQPVISDRAGL
jgi:hypothetical protein